MVTWLNSALRSSRKSSTIVGQVQIRQWSLIDPERVCEIHFDQVVAVSHHCTLKTRSLRRNQPSGLETWIKRFSTSTLIATAVKGSATIQKRVKTSWKIRIQHLTIMGG